MAVLSEVVRDGPGTADPILDARRLKHLSWMALLQRRSETKIEELLAEARQWNYGDLPGEQITISSVLQELSPAGDIALLGLAKRQRLQPGTIGGGVGLVEPDRREWARLARWREQEARLNAPDEPRGCVAPPPDATSEGLTGAPPDPAEWQRRLSAMSEASLLGWCRAGPPPAAWAWHQAYRTREQAGTLSAADRVRWAELLPTIENWNADRLLRLGELAARRGMRLEALQRQLEQEEGYYAGSGSDGR